MENVLNNLENEIKELKKAIEVKSNSIDIFDNDSILEEQTIFEMQIELDKKQKLYRKIKNFELIVRDNGENVDFIRIKDNKKNIKYCLYYFKNSSGFSVLIREGNKIINIDKYKSNNHYTMNSKKEGEEKYRHYAKIGKDKKEIYEMLLELYKLINA